MGTRGFIIYRVRGRYYVIYNRSDSYPTGLGYSLVSEIPEDPQAFEAWKLAQIASFRREEARILRLTREDPNRDDDDEDYWGYCRKPSRRFPINNLYIDWTYVIDLDLNVFCVSSGSIFNGGNNRHDVTQFFRLNNIPRELFTCEPPMDGDAYLFPVMSDSIPREHIADHLMEIPAPCPTLLALYASFSPAPTPTVSPTSTGRSPAWHNFHLRLLSVFVPYFTYSFRDAVPSCTSSPYVFRQLAYATLSLTSTPGLKFHLVPFMSTSPKTRTPSWEPPTTDTYWLGDVLIVLNPHVATTASGAPSASTQASIALASELASGTPTTAVLFSVYAIMLVHIAPEGITHTPVLPLFALQAAGPPFSEDALQALDAVGYATPGVIALLDLFAAHPRVRYVAGGEPGLLPTELWRAVVMFADEEVHLALEGTCRYFRELVREFPRVGGNTFVAWEGEGCRLAGGELVDICILEQDCDEEWGWEMAVWGREKVCLEMPLVVELVELVNEGEGEK